MVLMPMGSSCVDHGRMCCDMASPISENKTLDFIVSILSSYSSGIPTLENIFFLACV